MIEQSPKRIIQAFPRPDWVAESSCNCGTSNCASDSSCQGPKESLQEMMTNFTSSYGNMVEVHIADYTTDTKIGEAIVLLNKILEASQEDVRITREIFDLFMGHYSPLIAIDNKLAFIGGVPAIEQIVKALEIVPAPVV